MAGAVRASTASSSPDDPVLTRATGIAARTPGDRGITPAAEGASGSSRSECRSAPTANAAWSAAEPRQVWYCARARVAAAVAMMTSRIGPLCRTGRREISQPASAAASRLPRAAIRSVSLAAAGTRRSGITAAAARASAGATAMTGSMPIPPAEDCATAE